MAWKNAGNRHSDKEKFRSDLNRPESCEMSEPPLKALRKSGDFQAEYEGSIPLHPLHHQQLSQAILATY